jgi:hypothetical protein
VRAAGFDPDKMRMQGSWDRQKIIKKLQNMRDRNLPLYARYMLKNHPALFSSVRREFGSWNNTLRAAEGVYAAVIEAWSSGCDSHDDDYRLLTLQPIGEILKVQQ